METAGKSILKKVYPPRDPWAHKGEYGRLLIISGSTRFSGAPAMVGLAATRAGADMTFLVGPRRAMNTAMMYSPTFITEPLNGDFLDGSNVRQVFEFASEMKVNALVVGPGLWRNPGTKKAILKIIEGFDVPMVVDADAVRALAENPDAITGKNAIITPHADEFREFTDVKLDTNIEQRAKAVKEVAKDCKITVILKGHVDLISDGKSVAMNKAGDPRMAKAGTGDVLAGICGALLSRRKNKVGAYDAACAAAYINGRAGELAVKEKDEGITAIDVVDKIPNVIRDG